jgi:hypothetical protein
MKAILEFNLPDEREEYLRVFKADDMAAVLWEITYNSKKSICWEIEKEEQDGNTVSPYDAVEKVYKRLWDELSERDIDINKLYT